MLHQVVIHYPYVDIQVRSLIYRQFLVAITDEKSCSILEGKNRNSSLKQAIDFFLAGPFFRKLVSLLSSVVIPIQDSRQFVDKEF